MAKLADYVDIIKNSMECVVLKVRDNSRTGLIADGPCVPYGACPSDFVFRVLRSHFATPPKHPPDVPAGAPLHACGSRGGRKWRCPDPSLPEAGKMVQ